jgi:hypothetical protein
MEPAGAEAAALREVEQESAAVESALSGGTVAPEPVSDGPGAETAAAESAAAEAASPQSAGAEEAAAWAAPAESASSAPEWQMPSLPPDAIAAARRQEPVLGQIQDPLAGGGEPPAAPPVAASPENGSAIAEPPAEAAPTGSVEAGNGSAAAAPEEEDPDVVHWRETYDRFRELKQQLGEPADRLSFEKFAAKLKKNREDLVARHHCKGVRFSVYEKDGRAAIKASAIR